MAKYTIEELYRGDRYSIFSAVGAKAIRSGIDLHTADGQTWLEMELIRQTFITAEKMIQNGDCIAEGELGDAVTVSVFKETPENRALEQMKKHGCPAGEDPAVWLDKLMIAEKLDDLFRENKEESHEHS